MTVTHTLSTQSTCTGCGCPLDAGMPAPWLGDGDLCSDCTLEAVLHSREECPATWDLDLGLEDIELPF